MVRSMIMIPALAVVARPASNGVIHVIDTVMLPPEM